MSRQDRYGSIEHMGAMGSMTGHAPSSLINSFIIYHHFIIYVVAMGTDEYKQTPREGEWGGSRITTPDNPGKPASSEPELVCGIASERKQRYILC